MGLRKGLEIGSFGARSGHQILETRFGMFFLYQELEFLMKCLMKSHILQLGCLCVFLVRWIEVFGRFKEMRLQYWLLPLPLPGTNIAPANQWLEDEFSFGMSYFRGYVCFSDFFLSDLFVSCLTRLLCCETFLEVCESQGRCPFAESQRNEKPSQWKVS